MIQGANHKEAKGSVEWGSKRIEPRVGACSTSGYVPRIEPSKPLDLRNTANRRLLVDFEVQHSYDAEKSLASPQSVQHKALEQDALSLVKGLEKGRHRILQRSNISAKADFT